MLTVTVLGLSYVKLLMMFSVYETSFSNITKILEELHLCELWGGAASRRIGVSL